MSREPDIRPWNEKHKERRKVEGHPCNVVPAEMHTQMIDDRDKEIKILRGMTDKEGHHICSHGQCCACLKEPQPAREGWNVFWTIFWFIFIAVLGVFVGHDLPSAAPKETGDAWRQKCQIVWLELGCHDGDQRKICKVLSE